MELPLEQRLHQRERPGSRVVMTQRWEELLFLHWEWPVDDLQSRLPAGLRVDLFHGKAYLGIIPFFMRAVRPGWGVEVPWLSDFCELNVRTYVYDARGTPGVWFFSLDCNQPVAVEIARRGFHLPYYHAKMSGEACLHGLVDYRCRRRGSSDLALYESRVPAGSEPLEALPESLEFFLLERYALFSTDRFGHLWQGRVHHAPYRMVAPEVTQWSSHPLLWNGFSNPGRAFDHAVQSRGVAVQIHPLEPC